MSAKIAVSSSITWLIGWMRPGLGRRLAHRQRHVDGLGVEPRVERRVLERVAARGERRGDALLQAVDQRALLLALVRRHAAERLQQRRDRAALAERGDAHGFERGLVGGGGDRAERFPVRASAISLIASLRHQRQVGVVRLAAGLRQHAVHLAAMVRLVIEHVRDQQPFRLGDLALRARPNT